MNSRAGRDQAPMTGSARELSNRDQARRRWVVFAFLKETSHSEKQTTPEPGFSFFSQGSRAAHVGRSAGCFLESEVNNVMDKQFVRPGRVADVSLERRN